jgi:hypothetical protein
MSDRQLELSNKMTELLKEADNNTLMSNDIYYIIATLLDKVAISSIIKPSDNQCNSKCNSIIGILENLKLDFYNKLRNIGDFYNNENEQELFTFRNFLFKVNNEINTSELVYSYHGCDSWEDIFRDNVPELEEKARGIQIAIDEFLLRTQ